ncbi:hypothetical protein PACTADRAFT_48279 [Pachysolen tannophilus NRRL Y-2460]|uniref:C2H2-type domain-containing protein n=1 Tax=Pachysolen tannophilus NRRL Y-2460 TaxID=669874 RepID=A0A1E4U3Q4_PACTA|nr:hypothetical protein PACTADRAFT_48279 [Pachysolen tannophilus NRRL Y-2460]
MTSYQSYGGTGNGHHTHHKRSSMSVSVAPYSIPVRPNLNGNGISQHNSVSFGNSPFSPPPPPPPPPHTALQAPAQAAQAAPAAPAPAIQHTGGPLPTYRHGHNIEQVSSSVPLLSREFVVRRISEGETGRLKEELKCEACGKGYKHISSLAKHLWEHTPEWNVTKKLLISKHQQVQLLEAASILCSMNEPPLFPLPPSSACSSTFSSQEHSHSIHHHNHHQQQQQQFNAQQGQAGEAGQTPPLPPSFGGASYKLMNTTEDNVDPSTSLSSNSPSPFDVNSPQYASSSTNTSQLSNGFAQAPQNMPAETTIKFRHNSISQYPPISSSYGNANNSMGSPFPGNKQSLSNGGYLDTAQIKYQKFSHISISNNNGKKEAEDGLLNTTSPNMKNSFINSNAGSYLERNTNNNHKNSVSTLNSEQTIKGTTLLGKDQQEIDEEAIEEEDDDEDIDENIEEDEDEGVFGEMD